ncbi:MAG: hypothetical protein GKR89_36390 [Candidatus Latescibacteria bacterium]|nr:hypothetical protein [Candidatus Latescibacterota bacterium]
MAKSLPSDPSLAFARKQAKDILNAHRAGDESACSTLRLLPKFAGFSNRQILATPVTLQEVQHALALEHGCADWVAFRDHINHLRPPTAPALSKAPWGRAVFTGSDNGVPLQAVFKAGPQTGLSQDARGFTLSYRPTSDALPDTVESDIHAQIVAQIGRRDFAISLTLDPRSKPLAQHRDTEGQHFGLCLQFDPGIGTRGRKSIVFGFDSRVGSVQSGNRPFCHVGNGWSAEYVDDFDATGTAETITLRRTGDVYTLSNSSNGTNFIGVGGQCRDRAVHVDLNDGNLINSGRTLCGLALWTDSPGGRPFPEGAGRFTRIVVESPGLKADINPGRAVGDESAAEAGWITGRLSCTDRPLAKAQVALSRGSVFREPGAVQITEDDGFYRHRVAPGLYALKAQARGMEADVDQIVVEAGEVVAVDFDLTDLGTDFYVDAQAETGGDGRADAPFGTIQEALDVCSEGDTVHLAAGIYSEPVTLIPDVAICGTDPDRTRVTGKGYWGLALRPFMAQCYVDYDDDLVMLKAVLPNVAMEGFTLDGGEEHPAYPAETIAELLAMVMAVDRGDAAAVESFLRRNPALANACFHAPDADEEGATLLVRLAGCGDGAGSGPDRLRIAQLLLDYGADIEARGGQYHTVGETALGAAVWSDNGALLQFLLDRGAKLHHSFGRAVGQGPYLLAMVKLMMEAGADYTLHDLVKTNYTERLFADLDAAPERIDETLDGVADAGTPLHVAASQNRLEIGRQLLDRGAAVNALDGNGKTPLQLAVEKSDGTEALIKLLLERGATADLRVAISLKDTAVVDAILTADPTQAHQRTDQGWTLLDWAVEQGSPEIVERLRQAGARLDQNLEALLRQAPPEHPLHPLLRETPLPIKGTGHLHVDNAPSLDIRDQITLAAWVYLVKGHGLGTIVGKWPQWPATGSYVLHTQKGSSNGFVLRWDDGDSNHLKAFTLPFLQWVHYAATYDGQMMKVLVNGQVVAEEAAPNKRIASTQVPLRIGTSGFHETMPGLIHQVQIWNVARSGKQIQQSMRTGLAGNEPGLVGWWPMDAENPLADRSAMAHRGRLEGLATFATGAIPADDNHRAQRVLWLRREAE